MNETETKAVCGAYLMVAFADARYAKAEEGALLAGLINHPALNAVDTEQLSGCYNTLLPAFETDFKSAAQAVLGAIAEVKTNPNVVETITLAVRRAIVADAQITPQEEAALGHIAKALGLEEGSL